MAAGDFAINRLINRVWDYGSAVVTYYVRPGGNDNNNGLAPGDAFATFARAYREVALAGTNKPIRINVTGMDGANAITGDEVLQLGGAALGSISQDYDLNFLPPFYLGYRQQVQVVAEPNLVLALNVTGEVADADTGLLTLTVTNALAAGQLDDTIIIGDGFGEYGAVASYTTGAGPNTITVSSITPFTLPVSAYEPSAELRFGDAANAFEQAIYLNALCDWGFQFLRITSNGPKSAAITIWPHAPVGFLGCVISGLQVHGGAGAVTVDGCIVKDQIWAQDGGTMRVLASTIRDLSLFLCHGSGSSGLNEMTACHIIDCGNAYGAGNQESRFSFGMANVDVSGSLSDGVDARFGSSSLVECKLHDNAVSGIRVRYGASVYLSSVTGTGNAWHGVSGREMASINHTGTNVTGVSGDIELGAAGTIAWTAAPATDVVELVRVGSGGV